MEHGLKTWGKLKDLLQEGRNVVYLAGPLRGDGTPRAIAQNQARMAGLARMVQGLLPQAVLVVPHANFQFLDESGVEGLEVRTQILRACEALVSRCDVLLVAPGKSEGVLREMAAARRSGIPILHLSNAEEIASKILLSAKGGIPRS